MFARTERLLLRPGWAEDATALAAAIADEAIVRNLATAPWPYRLADAQQFLAASYDPLLPSFLLFKRTEAAPILIGSCGLNRRPSGAIELGYWIARSQWNQGYATEAATHLLDLAQALRIPRLEAYHFLDNPASGRVLEKLGFQATGLTAPRPSCARHAEAPARQLRLILQADETEMLAA